MPRSFLVKKRRKGGSRSPLPTDCVPCLGISWTDWTAPLVSPITRGEPAQSVETSSVQETNTNQDSLSTWTTGEHMVHIRPLHLKDKHQ